MMSESKKNHEPQKRKRTVYATFFGWGSFFYKERGKEHHDVAEKANRPWKKETHCWEEKRNNLSVLGDKNERKEKSDVNPPSFRWGKKSHIKRRKGVPRSGEETTRADDRRKHPKEGKPAQSIPGSYLD